MFSTGKDEQSTPQWFFDRLDAVFKFSLDPCASEVVVFTDANLDKQIELLGDLGYWVKLR